MISFCSYLVTIGEDIGKVQNFFRILVLGELFHLKTISHCENKII